MGSCSKLHITLFTTFIYFQLFSLQQTLSLDITKVLLENQNYNIFSSLLSDSGVIEDFNKAQSNFGITIFAPTDAAFANLSQSGGLQTLNAQQKILVLKYHAIHQFFPEVILKHLANPFQPTLATEASNNAGSFRFNLSRFRGKVVIRTGVGNGTVVLKTIYDHKPVAIYSLSHVLLPREFFK